MFLDEFDHIIKISIHALREEGDAPLLEPPEVKKYFYPRPPRGGRLRAAGQHRQHHIFLSTPSARRATAAATATTATSTHFYPRPPRGGRHLGSRPGL